MSQTLISSIPCGDEEYALCLSPDGTLVASVSESRSPNNSTITLWHVPTGKQQQSFKGNFPMVFSADGKSLAYTFLTECSRRVYDTCPPQSSFQTWFETVKLRDIRTETDTVLLARLEPDSRRAHIHLQQLALSPDNKRLATVTKLFNAGRRFLEDIDYSTELWDQSGNALVKQCGFSTDDGNDFLAFSGDGALLIAVSNQENNLLKKNAYLLDTASKRVAIIPVGPMYSISVASESRTLAFAVPGDDSFSDVRISIWHEKHHKDGKCAYVALNESPLGTRTSNESTAESQQTATTTPVEPSTLTREEFFQRINRFSDFNGLPLDGKLAARASSLSNFVIVPNDDGSKSNLYNRSFLLDKWIASFGKPHQSFRMPERDMPRFRWTYLCKDGPLSFNVIVAEQQNALHFNQIIVPAR